MEQENKNQRIFPLNAIRVCINECDEDLKGEIYSKMCAEPLQFNSCSEMLLRADRLFDECGYPQTFQEKRNFVGPSKTASYAYPEVRLSDHDVIKHRGKYCTIDILVRSRMRAGWQGIVLREKGIPPSEFQSELELLEYLIHIKNDLSG